MQLQLKPIVRSILKIEHLVTCLATIYLCLRIAVQYVLLFLVWFNNSHRFQILRSYALHPFLCTLAQGHRHITIELRSSSNHKIKMSPHEEVLRNCFSYCLLPQLSAHETVSIVPRLMCGHPHMSLGMRLMRLSEQSYTQAGLSSVSNL